MDRKIRQTVSEPRRRKIVLETRDYAQGDPAGKALVWDGVGSVDIEWTEDAIVIDVVRVDEAQTGRVEVKVH